MTIDELLDVCDDPTCSCHQEEERYDEENLTKEYNEYSEYPLFMVTTSQDVFEGIITEADEEGFWLSDTDGGNTEFIAWEKIQSMLKKQRTDL